MGYLRRAKLQDADLLFQWANEKTVRKNSFSTDEISLEEHMRWYEGILSASNIVQYIYMDDDGPAGQIRMNIHGQEAVVSYSICMEKRCMGYGKDMMGCLMEHVRREYPQLKKLTAKVKPENTASQKMLLDMGYEETYDVFELDLKQAKTWQKYAEYAGGGRGGYCF